MKIRLETLALSYVVFMCYGMNLLPILRGLIPIPGIGGIKEIVSFIIILLFIRSHGHKVSHDIFYLFSILCFVIAFGLARDLNVTNVFDSLRYSWMYGLCLYLIYTHFKSKNINFFRKHKEYILLHLYISCTIVFITAVLEVTIAKEFIKSLHGEYSLNDFYGGEFGVRLTSTIGNPIMLGYTLLLFSLLTTYILTNRGIILFVNLVTFIVICLTFSRIAVFITVLFSLIYSISVIRKNPVLTILVVGILYFVWPYLNAYEDSLQLLLQRLSEASVDAILLDPRVTRWLDMLQNTSIFLMLVGHGIGIFGWNSGQLFSENLYLAISYEYGISGFIFFAVFMIYYFRLIFESQIPRGEKRYYIGCLGIFLIGGFVSDLHLTLPFSFILWLNLCLLKGSRYG